MYYILYRLDTLKVVHRDTKPLKPQNMSVYGIAEYHGELPKNDWLTVDNVHEEIETWTETHKYEKLDALGGVIVDEQGNVVYEEIKQEMLRNRIVCDLVAHFYPKVELTEEQKAAQKEKQYNSLVTKLIRQKYSADAVEALLANYAEDDVKYQVEFAEFAAYRKECKAKARQEIYNL